MEKQLYNVGKIINTHGIKGEVKVHRVTDFDERFEPGQLLYWVNDKQEKPKPLVIRTHRVHKGFDLVSFEEHPSINDVEPYKNGMLMVSEEEQEELDDHEFYFHEIIGCKVFLESGAELGEVKEILTPGANDVWVVKRKQQSDVLLPYIEPVVKEVDTERKAIIIDPIEGLLD
ncbi:16S rRNA processing protein RimM [Halobacillus karajensis]|uniref:Ribosome maturation factor RimM n=1 Tax=Halobacillus karajensis TaxID=195088 RepID=A0A024P3L4_9BACI|nr:ribosome maturation factor RimM [Halobacillus karajensis]CDQ19762.1 Ribosome maturation factor RimM [Halobacillus karajensis]CDQ22222.1 Ribosome maturation factor RimM [Halobacillus karajensis]CDQ28063.1 Ribosome maturation factor RimM [Halobacillus karajensis]SEH72599.1 16S rRNA processing protein RimM [Halobacillus karajensis]